MREVWGFPTSTWQVIGDAATAGTFLVALAAAIIAGWQLRLYNVTRLDQTRPYVTVTAEDGETSRHFVDIVIRNIGASPARQVEITVDPPLQSSVEDAEHPISHAKVFTEPIVFLAPGAMHRLFYDSHIQRNARDDLPSAHKVTVSYDDQSGHHWSETYTLDIDAGAGQVFTEIYGVHHLAQAAREIATVVKRPAPLRGSLDVTVESRDERDARLERERAELQTRAEEFRASQARLRAEEANAHDETEGQPGERE